MGVPSAEMTLGNRGLSWFDPGSDLGGEAGHRVPVEGSGEVRDEMPIANLDVRRKHLGDVLGGPRVGVPRLRMVAFECGPADAFRLGAVVTDEDRAHGG